MDVVLSPLTERDVSSTDVIDALWKEALREHEALRLASRIPVRTGAARKTEPETGAAQRARFGFD